MKIIHFADLHIGSKFERLPIEVGNKLNIKLRNAFTEIINYAKSNNITTIIMSGDIFDKNTVTMKDKIFFYDSIKENPQMDFYYIKGNHDCNSKYNEDEEIENLHTFDGLQSYIKEDVRIIGYELDNDNSTLYNCMPFTTDKFNIMMLHGDINNPRDKNYIDIKKLQNKNIDYLALGHIHKRKVETIDNLKYGYSGCVLGRGFDEVGDKGYLVLDTSTKEVIFNKLNDIVFEKFDVQVDKKNEIQLKNEISNLLGDKNDSVITEIKLVGKTDIELDTDDITRIFEDLRYYLVVKNSSRLALDYKVNMSENSLRNSFINKVHSDTTIDEDTKEEVIAYGLSKLMKEEG